MMFFDGSARVMRVVDGESRSNRSLARRFQSLRPDTTKTIPLRKEIEQIPIGRPVFIKVKVGAVRDSHPFLFFGGDAIAEGDNQNLALPAAL